MDLVVKSMPHAGYWGGGSRFKPFYLRHCCLVPRKSWVWFPAAVLRSLHVLPVSASVSSGYSGETQDVRSHWWRWCFSAAPALLCFLQPHLWYSCFLSLASSVLAGHLIVENDTVNICKGTRAGTRPAGFESWSAHSWQETVISTGWNGSRLLSYARQRQTLLFASVCQSRDKVTTRALHVTPHRISGYR